ncbi:hypothetical protein CXB51_022197 [Gossypium anomalum]|uniref:RNase H type-1 domain-containing protein n=1 Tax=Gossypium anomalum TaxID=47600 RepID=A0A8J5Y5K7_9ROSI|nr:hypothetical protein CXB51_022197 [Gossypium anomalum]
MGQSTKSTQPGPPHTGRSHGHVNLAELKHDSHGLEPAEYKMEWGERGTIFPGLAKGNFQCMDTCCRITCAIWFIWSERNMWVHDRVFALTQQIAHKILQYLQELNRIQKKLPISSASFEIWKSPEDPYIKINFDTMFLESSSNSCSGIVIRDSKSRILAETITLNDNLPSAFAAEALKCLQVLRDGIFKICCGR